MRSIPWSGRRQAPSDRRRCRNSARNPKLALPEPKASPALPALRPAAPTSSASDAAARTDRIRRYVEQYNGGDCFFILPVAISSNAAVIEGFGASTAPFDALDKAFKRELGFEASIGARLVTQAQCPAIKFLGQLGGNQARAPRINLDSVEIKNGETLSGTIENFANRVVELLLVSDSGEVKNLSYLAEAGHRFPVILHRDAAQRRRRWSATGVGRDDAAGSRFLAAAQTHGR